MRMINFPYTRWYKRIEKGGSILDPRAKDTELRWEMIALAKQIGCLLADPDLLVHNDGTTVPSFGRHIEELYNRSRFTERYHHPTQQEFAILLKEIHDQLMELMMVQLAKHQRWCEEQSKTHWSDTVRALLKNNSLYLVDLLARLATGDPSEIVREVLSTRPPIVVLD